MKLQVAAKTQSDEVWSDRRTSNEVCSAGGNFLEQPRNLAFSCRQSDLRIGESIDNACDGFRCLRPDFEFGGVNAEAIYCRLSKSQSMGRFISGEGELSAFHISPGRE
jgi:hypothetical protein